MKPIYHSIKPIAARVIVHYKAGVCPVCEAAVSMSVLGAGSHLRSHLRRGEIDRQVMNECLNKVLGRVFKGEGL